MLNRILRTFIFGAVVSGAIGPDLLAAEGWKADPKIVEAQSKARPNVLYQEEKVPAYTLPDALMLADGKRVASVGQWEQKGRPQTLELFRKHVYGRTPAMDSVKFEVLQAHADALEGKATRKQVRITSTQGGKSFAFEAWVLIPNQRQGKVPAFVVINNRAVTSADPMRQAKDGFWPAEEIIARGYATAVFRTNDVDPDRNGPEARAQGVRGVFTPPGEAAEKDGWATIAAWAWGASRVLDYLVSEEAIDAAKVAVIGQSRGGKTALWAGAEDTRFAMAISNCSGCGGASLERRRFGETIAMINRSFPYWFCGNYKSFNDRENDLPIDTHQLMALIAPRAVAVGSADQDLWADPRGEFLALAHAGPVYGLFGLPTIKAEEMPPLDTALNRGQMHHHIRSGVHNLTAENWKHYLDFADSIWKRK